MFAFSFRLIVTAGLLAVTPAGVALAKDQVPGSAQVDFGSDTSEWANDGECDDPRFEGPGMTSTTLLDSDILRDATDCRTAFDAGRLALRKTPQVDFGRDSSEWANDGECDDPRFEGPGMTDTTLLDSDKFGDATDCKSAFDAGQLKLRSVAPPKPQTSNGVRFGTDSSQWANDGECDDPRFEGPGMTETTLLDTDRFADATDCKAAFDAGRLTLR